MVVTNIDRPPSEEVCRRELAALQDAYECLSPADKHGLPGIRLTASYKLYARALMTHVQASADPREFIPPIYMRIVDD